MALDVPDTRRAIGRAGITAKVALPTFKHPVIDFVQPLHHLCVIEATWRALLRL
jgi:hypothetical protein